jgi:membrane associated rhomboid family serine protease
LYQQLNNKVDVLAVTVIYSAFSLGTLLGGLLTFHSKFGKNNPLHLGSSSGVFALLTLLVLLLPKNNIYILGFIPINSLTFLGIFTLLSTIALFKNIPYFDMVISFSKHKVNHAGHLGGVIAGVISYAILFI